MDQTTPMPGNLQQLPSASDGALSWTGLLLTRTKFLQVTHCALQLGTALCFLSWVALSSWRTEPDWLTGQQRWQRAAPLPAPLVWKRWDPRWLAPWQWSTRQAGAGPALAPAMPPRLTGLCCSQWRYASLRWRVTLTARASAVCGLLHSRRWSSALLLPVAWGWSPPAACPVERSLASHGFCSPTGKGGARHQSRRWCFEHRYSPSGTALQLGPCLCPPLGPGPRAPVTTGSGRCLRWECRHAQVLRWQALSRCAWKLHRSTVSWYSMCELTLQLSGILALLCVARSAVSCWIWLAAGIDKMKRDRPSLRIEGVPPALL